MAPYIKHPLIKPKTIESRLYQEVLAARVLDAGNSLVVAPTALGKTIVAVLLTAYLLERDKSRKILFLAPTKPLAVQHQKSFEKFLNVKKAKIALLTGTVQPKKRSEIWEKSQLVAATPQTIENDLAEGRIGLGDTALVIFDEAHRAVKDYSYVYIAKKYIKQQKNPLILGLTASPGSEKGKIQEVCRNLSIKNIEIKTQADADVKPYTQEITFEWVKVQLPDEFLRIKKLLENFMREQLLFLKKLGYAKSINAQYFGKRQMLELQKRISRDLVQKGKTRPSLYAGASRVASLLKISHAHTLLETQGIFALQDYFNRMKVNAEKPGAAKAFRFVLGHNSINEAMDITEKLYDKGINHPKLNKLIEILKRQFVTAPESRVLVFNHYRDSIKNLEKALESESGISAKRFIGQATRDEDKGMSQKEQIAIINDLKEGKCNTLLCSSVAEEGLDIPAVDLVVFFEAVPSEIRSIQRRGRTGRFSKGKVVILMAKGTRDESYYWASIAKEKRMHKTLGKMKEGLGMKREKQSTLVKFTNEAKNKVLVYADTREQGSDVVKELKEMDCLVKVKQLEVGDYIVSDEIVVERKTIDDFLSSIIDGRLFEQLFSMASNYPLPLMIVEGNLELLYSLRNIHRNAIIGTLTSIALNYKTPILFTKNQKETAEFIYVTAKREQLGKERDIRLRIGRKGITLGQQQRFVVESLPLVGPRMALALLKKFGSIKNIANAKSSELKEVENLGQKKAKYIKRVLTAKYKEEEDKPEETIK